MLFEVFLLHASMYEASGREDQIRKDILLLEAEVLRGSVDAVGAYNRA